MANDSEDTLGVKKFIKIVLSHTVSRKNVFAFYAEIQDGSQKWWEKTFLAQAEEIVFNTMKYRTYNKSVAAIHISVS